MDRPDDAPSVLDPTGSPAAASAEAPATASAEAPATASAGAPAAASVGAPAARAEPAADVRAAVPAPASTPLAPADLTRPPGPPPYWSPLTPDRPAAWSAPPRPRWRRTRRALLLLAVVGVAAAAGATVVAVRTAQLAGTPQAAVQDYFDALARGDARTALASGDVPAGGRALVGDDVLRAVLERSPIQDVRTGTVTRSGDAATVAVRYRLGGASPAEVDDTVDVVRQGDRWRLRRSAVPVDLSVTSAASWAAVPAPTPFALPGTTQLVFPGAVPVLFRSPRLQVAPESAVVRFAQVGDTLRVAAAVSERGRADVIRAVRAAVTACAAGGSGVDPFCPQPPAGRDGGVVLRSVPRSFAGTLTGLDQLAPDVAVTPDDAGVITVSGTVAAEGSWRVLDYDNVALDRDGTTTITFGATLAVGSDTLVWERT